MANRPPDRLCSERGTRYFNAKACKDPGIAINGVEQHGQVVEYCVSKGWARVLVFGPNGQAVPGALGIGKRTRMVHGRIVVWWRSQGAPFGVVTSLVEAPGNAAAPVAPEPAPTLPHQPYLAP